MLNGIVSALDILVVAMVVYWLILLVKGTRAEMMLWGLSVIVIVYFLSQRMGFYTLHWILTNFLGSIVIIIVVVFQQDIRRALMRMGRPFASRELMYPKEFLSEIINAVSALSERKEGALIVVEREFELKEIVETGVDIDAKVSEELLLSIFNPNSPLHDGAVVVRGGRVVCAGCILPLTEREMEKGIGTRHRAALGLTEETDAVVLVVSERTGEVSLVVGDDLESGLDSMALLTRLKQEFTRKGSTVFPWK